MLIRFKNTVESVPKNHTRKLSFNFKNYHEILLNFVESNTKSMKDCQMCTLMFISMLFIRVDSKRLSQS